MICKSCNKEIDNDSNFCKYCGEKVCSSIRKLEEIKFVNAITKEVLIVNILETPTKRDLLNFFIKKRFIPNNQKILKTVVILEKINSLPTKLLVSNFNFESTKCLFKKDAEYIVNYKVEEERIFKRNKDNLVNFAKTKK